MTRELLAPPPSSLRELPFAVIDLETTGGSPKAHWDREERVHPASEITEVGLVTLCGTVVQDRWNSLAAIEGPFPAAIQRLTGITPGLLAGAPPWERVALAFAARAEGRIWVAHHAPFDGSFLKAWCPEGLWKRHRLVCTRLLAKRFAPEVGSFSLASLCGFFGIHNRRAHRALADAEATAELLGILIRRAEEQGVDAEAFLATGTLDWARISG